MKFVLQPWQLLLLAGWINRHQQRVIEYLQAENQVLKEKRARRRVLLTAPRSPWQTPYVERLIGSMRRECLDHILTINEESLRATLRSYFSYYHDSRCHLALDKDSPDRREVQPPERGMVVEIANINGLHHRYERRAA